MKDRCEDVISLRRTSRQSVGRPKKAEEPEHPRIPQVSRLMALAIKLQDMMDRREVRDYADLARLGYVTRARITQIMNLLLLAPEIQEALVEPRRDLAFGPGATEHELRMITRHALWTEQRKAWSDLRARWGTAQQR